MSLRVLYIAKHGSGGGDDEGAVADAFERLGHEVERVQETFHQRSLTRAKADFLLFHHWRTPSVAGNFRGPRIFWNFDLVEWPCRSLEGRNQARRKWMREATAVADIGFCTDGDWVVKDRTGKLHWLPQGADQRNIGRGERREGLGAKVLFTGIGAGGGLQREEWVKAMRDRYGGDFLQVAKGCHGEALADLIASSRIVVAPIAPVSGTYWSNRVYGALARGAFLLHPWSEGLIEQYPMTTWKWDGIVYYQDMDELAYQIATYSSPEMDRERIRISEAGIERTKAEHTYLHRVERLVEIVRTELGL